MLRHIHSNFGEHLRARLDQLVPLDLALPLPRAALLGYLEGALLALLSWWMEHGAAYSAAQMSAMFRDLVLPGMLNALPLPREQVEAFL